MFMSFITPKTRERPRAINAYKPPNRMPIAMGVERFMKISKPIYITASLLAHAKVGFSHLFFFSKVLSFPAQSDTPAFQNIGSISFLKASPHVLLHQDDSNTPGSNFP